VRPKLKAVNKPLHHSILHGLDKPGSSATVSIFARLLSQSQVLATWRRGLAAVAACPNVYLKLGGIGMPRPGFDWHARPKPIGSDELATAMAPLMTDCIAQFGPDRCMFESNFPPDKVSFSHHVLFNAFKRFSQGYSAAERAALFHDTAARAYRISAV
jgi:predicted TIM-barrel fold metal-dependent hydrolase